MQVMINFDPFTEVETSTIHESGIHIKLKPEDDIRIKSDEYTLDRLIIGMTAENQLKLAREIIWAHEGYPDQQLILNAEHEKEMEELLV